ncbi:MAG: GAF domain-containing protein [Chloroflexota bacterium]
MAINRLDAVRDPTRLAALRATGLLGTPPDESFDRLTRLAIRALRVPIALFSLIDASHQFLKSQQGLGEPWASRRELPLTHSFCWLVVATGETLAVADGRQHPSLAGLPAIDELGVVAYLGAPIATDAGQVIGTLAALDHQPRQWSDDDARALRDLASLAATEVNRGEPDRAAAAAAQSIGDADPRARLLERLGDGVCALDHAGRCIFVNRAGASLLGYRSEEILGQPLPALVHHSRLDGSPYPPEETPCMRSIATGEVLRVEDEVFWRRDLTPLAVRYSAFPVAEDGKVTGGVIVFADATEHRRAGEARERLLAREQAARRDAEADQQRLAFLSRASAQLAASLDEATTLRDVTRLIVPHLADWCAIDLIDATGTIRRAEAVHRDSTRSQLLREAPDRLADGPGGPRSVSSVIRSGQAEVASDVTDRDLFAAARESAQVHLLRAIGCRSYLCAPLVARGTTLGAITLAQVEPGRRFQQLDLFFAEDLARRIASAIDNGRQYQEARNALRARNEFLVTVAHDLRNPLANIKGYTQLLLRAFPALKLPESNELLGWLERVDSTTTRMTSQIDELLDLARVQIGQSLELDRRPMNLVTFARQVTETYQQTTNRHIVRFETSLANVVGFWDARRLERVLNNLLANAIKYSPDGGEITTSVGVEERDGRPWAVLSVKDHGVGISAADLPHVFERFYRGRNVADRSTGSGVGLASVHQIVTHHGGTVDVASDEGVGTTFTIRLPPNLPNPASA